MALIKSDNDSLREVFIQWMYTNTHTLATHKHRDLQSRFGREKTDTSTNSEEKPLKGSQHLSKETMKKPSRVASNTSSFNDCLHLTCFIVTK